MREIAQRLLESAQRRAADLRAKPAAWAPELHPITAMRSEAEAASPPSTGSESPSIARSESPSIARSESPPIARVLIVEDEAQLRRILARTMVADGFAVAEAGSLAAARTLLGGEAFGAAVLDVGLPDGDGLSLLAALPPERVVIVTANPDARVLAEAGQRRVLAKPVDLRELRSVVRRLATA